MTQLHVCFVAPTLPQSGNHTTSHRIATLLQRRGVNVTLLDSRAFAHELIGDASFDACLYLHALRAGSAVFPATQSGAAATIAARRYVLILGGTDANEAHTLEEEATMARVVRSSTAVVCFSDALRNAAVLKWPEVAQKAVVIPQSVEAPEDIESTSRAAMRNHLDQLIAPHLASHVVILPAGLRPVKGIDFALQIWRAIRTEESGADFAFLIAGPTLDPSCGEMVSEEIARSGGRLCHVADASRAELFSLYQHPRTLCVLNTSRSEGQPQAVLEAMLVGRCVCVVRAIAGNLAVVSPSTGIIVETPQDAAREIIALPQRSDLSAIIAAAKAAVEEHHSPEHEANGYLALIRD